MKSSAEKLEYNRKYREANRDKIKAKKKAAYVPHSELSEEELRAKREKTRATARKNRKENPEVYKKATQKYRHNLSEEKKKEIRDKERVTKRLRQRERMKTDIQFMLKRKCQCRLKNALKSLNIHKTQTTTELLGCSPAELKLHIESKFLPGMSWENRHLWHIDHIRPVSSFNLIDLEQQKECFNYTNLQPLWAKDNLKKGNKYNG